MSYTPALGNAANFDFTVSGYTPPAGNGTSFSFSTGSSGTVATGAGSILGKAVVSGISSEITRSQGNIAGQSALSGVSVAGWHGTITGRAILSGSGVAAKPALATLVANATVTGVGHALASSTGSVQGKATLSGVSQAGYHGSIAGQAQLSGVGLARRFVTGAGAIQGKALLSGSGLGANALKVLLATRQFVMADLFTLTLARTGQTINVTNIDRPVWWNNTFYDPYSLAIEGLQFKKSVGLSVDEQSLSISATRDQLINGQPWFDEIANGLLDNAEIRRERVFAPDWNSPPVGSVILFDGIVSTIDSLTTTQCQLKVKSYLSLLNQPMPRNSWQTSCLHTLFDAGCKLSKAAYQVSGQVGAGSTVNTLNWSGATSGYYWQGMISFTSGPNMGLSRTIKLATGNQLMLHLPLPWMPVAGDLFFAYPGCDKTYLTCQNRFNNTAHNRSYPYIPSATLAL
ncbi:MAG: DUF2163 domain-containing protein [Ferrovum myxofaciens]|uniref:DUF2163 domain-containing protein n=1 Tax=Ferrovum myxofaciens TaxID=416213 RepID=UPI00235515F0|nr:DUF2163 domain-containing protein [Ferrovum myxofaciens]QKE41977.1 MAG: DUF2163 domain-containing protein [Ferrovum myxofaciens]